MKKIAFVLINVLLFGVGTIKAQDQLLSDSEPISSGCLKRNNRSNGDEASSLPTIKLTKEGKILSVDLLNYESNCGTTGFDMESQMSSGNDDIPSVVISVVPVIPAEKDCYCPFNISYTVRDFEKNKFFLTCWWYEGEIELTEGEPLVLEYKTEDVIIDGLKFTLLKTSHQAKLLRQDTWDDEVLQIPSEVEYEGEKYIVTSINESVFASNTVIKRITIPKTIKNTDFGSLAGITKNPFYSCLSLEKIEVDEENPAICSIDGVLFNKDKTILISYPAASPRESYSVPDNVKRTAMRAFVSSQHLKNIVLPDNMETLGLGLFAGGNSLEKAVLPSNIIELPTYLFQDCIKLKSVVIPSGITSICYGAFVGCETMQSFNLPESISFIDDFAFGQLPNLKHMYCHSTTVPNTNFNAFNRTDLSQVTLHVPAASVSAYQAAEQWKDFKEIVALTNQGEETDDSDYIPFVEMGKQWHVVRSDCNSGSPIVHYENYMLGEEVVKNGKTYLKMYRSEDDLTVLYESGLLREEDRKVYIYDADKQEEHLIFDYSLKAGDTYEAYSSFENNMVSYKVMSVDDCTECPGVRTFYNDENADSTVISYRKLRQWTVCRADNESLQKTWIEGVGSFKGPLENLQDIVLPDLCEDYLAYVEYYDYYFPFSFYDAFGQIHGCNLPTGEKDYSEDWHHQLTYELEGDRLHVYGKIYTQCGPNNYIYFTEEPTDDPLVRRLRFSMQEILPHANCTALHATNFYVPGFDPNMNYIVVDDQGAEHPVINKTPQMAYRPFVEEGKVWQVGAEGSGNPVQIVEYYYFDGDTIIDGKACKQMMCQRFVSPDSPKYDAYLQQPSLNYVGAWYEEDKKVYEYDSTRKEFMMMYDFSLEDNGTFLTLGQYYVVGPRQTGGMKGFKGIYRDVLMYKDGGSIARSTPWLEGVGGIYGPTVNVFDGELADPMWFLMACAVDDEVIYLNDEYEDGATPENMGAQKRRFDFTHTVKTQPKVPMRREAEQSLYGEYNDKLLGINLDPIDDAYLVRITDETGKVVYEKAIDAGNIVALNVDISSYAIGRYTVTVENSQESFTGEFETQTTGIEEICSKRSEVRDYIYNLQGQRLTSLQKGLNIVNGKKVYVK